jgi:hypothetical protein
MAPMMERGSFPDTTAPGSGEIAAKDGKFVKRDPTHF